MTKPRRTKWKNISQKRRDEILAAIMSAALECVHIKDVVHCLEGDANSPEWENLFRDKTDTCGVLADAISQGNIDHLEINALIEPFFAQAFEDAVGSVKIKATWQRLEPKK